MAVFVPIHSQAWPMQRGYGFPHCRSIRHPHCTRRPMEVPFWNMIQEGVDFRRPLAQCGGRRDCHPHPFRVDPLQSFFIWNRCADDKKQSGAEQSESDNCARGPTKDECRNVTKADGAATSSKAACEIQHSDCSKKWVQTVNIGNIKPENLDVRVIGNTIVVSVSQELCREGDKVVAFVKVRQEFEAPTEGVDLDQLKAIMQPNGVLSIEAPRTGVEDEQPDVHHVQEVTEAAEVMEHEETQPGNVSNLNESEGPSSPVESEETVSQLSPKDDETPIVSEQHAVETMTEENDSLPNDEGMEVSKESEAQTTPDMLENTPTDRYNAEDFEIVSITPTGKFYTEDAVCDSEENKLDEETKPGESQMVDPSQFKTQLNLGEFLPEDISVKTVDQCLTIHAKHTEESEGYRSHREVFRSFQLPEHVDVDSLKSTLESDGTFSVVSKSEGE